MFNNWLSAYVSKYTDDIPDYLKMSRDEMLDDIPDWLKMSRDEMLDEVAMEFIEGDITYSELCDEYELIEEMFADENDI